MPRRGAWTMIGAAALFSLMGASVKSAAAGLPNEMVVFFRNAVGLLLLLPWAARAGRAGLATRRPGGHAVRGLVGLAAMYFFFLALARMRLADALSLSYTMPLFMPVIARLWLKEPVPGNLAGVLAIGFAGVLLVLKPGAGVFQAAALAALLSGFLGSVAQVGIRGLTGTEPAVRIVFYFSLISAAVSAVPAALVWRAPPSGLWPVLLALGVSATVAQVLLTLSYQAAPPAAVGPFIYTAVVFAGILDWALWGKLPDKFSVAGATLICLAGALAFRFSRPQEAALEART